MEICRTNWTYWRKQLGAICRSCRCLPIRPRPAVQSFRGAMQPVAFSRDLADTLKLLSRQEGATLFMTLLTGFAICCIAILRSKM